MPKPLNDAEALRLAMQMACAEDADRAEQIAEMLQEQPWREVAEFAACVAQSRSLHLKPWQWPPAWGPDQRDDPQGGKLLDEMLRLGVSQWHPDPMRAIEEARAATETAK
jgi:hypothetical protein